MKKLLLIAIALISSCTMPFVKKAPHTFNDMVYLKNGEEYHCEVIGTKDTFLIFITEKGETSMPLSKILSVDLARKRQGYNWKSVSDITDKTLLEALKFPLADFKGMGYVNIYVEKKLKINRDSTYVYTERYIRGITDERGRSAGNISKLYRWKNEKLQIDFARTVTGDGKVINLREIAIEDASIYSRYPEHENMHERKFAMPEVKPGNILDWEISIRGKITKENPFVMDEYIGDNGPTADAYFIVEFPSDFDVAYSVYGMTEPEVKKQGKNTTYVWHVKRIPPLLREIMSPPPVYLFPRVVAGLKSSWNDIVEEYKEFLSVKGTLSPDSAYKLVLKTIKYIDVPSSGSCIFPRKAEEILKTKTGNSLEKAYLLYTLINKDKHHVELVLVRSKERGMVSVSTPSLLQFDGALVRCDSVWYDPSYEIIPPGYIRPEYQGVYALSLSSGAILKIPLLEPEKESETIRRSVKLYKNGDALIKDRWIYRGKKLLSIRAWKYLQEEERRKQIEGMIGNQFPNAELKRFSIEHLNDLCDSIVINTEYTVDKLGTVEGKFLLLKTPGILYSAYYVGMPERNYPIYLKTSGLSRTEIEILPPKGYRIHAYPENIKYDSPVSSFYSTYDRIKRKLIYTDEYVEKTDFVPSSRYQEYRECIMNMAKIPQRWIVFKK